MSAVIESVFCSSFSVVPCRFSSHLSILSLGLLRWLSALSSLPSVAFHWKRSKLHTEDRTVLKLSLTPHPYFWGSWHIRFLSPCSPLCVLVTDCTILTVSYASQHLASSLSSTVHWITCLRLSWNCIVSLRSSYKGPAFSLKTVWSPTSRGAALFWTCVNTARPATLKAPNIYPFAAIAFYNNIWGCERAELCLIPTTPYQVWYCELMVFYTVCGEK